MPRPVPDYVPNEIQELIFSQGFAGLKDFQQSKIPDINLYKLCGSTHSRLRKFKTLCHLAGVPLQILGEKAEAAEDGYIQSLIDLAVKNTGVPSKYALQAHARLGNLYALEDRSTYANLLSYKRFADALQVSLDDLAKWLFDSNHSLLTH